MNGLVIGMIAALSLAQQQTDTTFAVGTARSLSVESMGGSIEVGVWDRDEIRVQAEHSNRTFIEIDRGRREIQVESEARRGPANLVDFRITVPRTFSLDLEALYGDIVVDGSDGEVQAETVQGDITIVGGRGTIEVSATTGNITVDDAAGKIEIESSSADIRITNSSGEIYAETAGGTIVLENVSPSAVDVGSTGGRVHYEGSFEPNGTYFFGAHGGSITIVVPEGASASFSLATVHGSISSNLSGQVESLRSGERHSFDVGEGGALVEAETYGGRIRILRSGSEGSSAPHRQRIREGEQSQSASGLALGLGFDLALDHHFDLDLDHDFDFDLDHDFDFDLDLDHHFDLDLDVDAAFGHALELATAVVPHVELDVPHVLLRRHESIRNRQPATIRR